MLRLERSFALVYRFSSTMEIRTTVPSPIWAIAIDWLEYNYIRNTVPRLKTYITDKRYLMKVLDTNATPEEILELFDLFRRNKVAYPDFVTGYIVLEPKDIDTIIKIN